MGTSQVKQHVRKTSTGKMVVVKSHTKTVKSMDWDALSKLTKKRVANKEMAKHLLNKYKKYPNNLEIMINGKWKNVPITEIKKNPKTGKNETFKSLARQLNYTNDRWGLLIKENSGLIHRLVSRYAYNEEMYQDLYQAAITGMFEACNNYETKFDPSNPPLLEKAMQLQMASRVRQEMSRQVATRFRLPYHKSRLYSKFTSLYDELGGDYDAIYDKMDLKKKDLYPDMKGAEGLISLPKEGYVTVTKESVLESKTQAYEDKVNKLRNSYENEKALLQARLNGGITEEDKIAYEAAEDAINERIKNLEKKRDESKSNSEKVEIDKKIQSLEEQMETLAREIKPLDEESHKKELGVLKDKYNYDLREAKEKFKKEVGKTTIQGAYALFSEFEQIMSFKDVNVGGEKNFGEGDVASIESVIASPNTVNPEDALVIRSSFVQNLDKFEDALDSLNEKTRKVLKMHLGLSKENEPYAHGLWGVPMETTSEIARNLPKGFYERDDMGRTLKERTEEWKKRKPEAYKSVKLTPAAQKKAEQSIKDWEKRRNKAKKEISKKVAKIKGSEQKAKFREMVYKKHKANISDKPTAVKFKKVKRSAAELKAETAKWKKLKPTGDLGEVALRKRVAKDLEFGKIALRQIYSVKDYRKLMEDYSDMRAYNLSKANLVDDLRKSMVVDKFFNHTFRFAKTEEDNILLKAYKKIKGLFKTLAL